MKKSKAMTVTEALRKASSSKLRRELQRRLDKIAAGPSKPSRLDDSEE